MRTQITKVLNNYMAFYKRRGQSFFPPQLNQKGYTFKKQSINSYQKMNTFSLKKKGLLTKPDNFKKQQQQSIKSKKTLQQQLQKPSKPYTYQNQILNPVTFNQQQITLINNANKYFQGIRMNTAYSKFYNQYPFTKIDGTAERKLNDLPFNARQPVHITADYIEQAQQDGQNKEQSEKLLGSGKKAQTKQQKQKLKRKPDAKTGNNHSNKVDTQIYRQTKLCSYILNKTQPKKLTKILKQIASNYFTDIINKKRTVKIQPNFQRQARRTIQSLKRNGYEFKLQKNENFRIKILNAQLFKGIQVIRNNNYSIDSYNIIPNPNYTQYKLWQRGSYKIPQQQWFTQFNILLRITAQVQFPYSITVSKNNESSVSNKNKSHIFVFETNLRRPPRFSQFRLSPQQHLKLYEIDTDDTVITNVDNRNQYSAFTYEEKQKKQKLINKLV